MHMHKTYTVYSFTQIKRMLYGMSASVAICANIQEVNWLTCVKIKWNMLSYYNEHWQADWRPASEKKRRQVCLNIMLLSKVL